MKRFLPLFLFVFLVAGLQAQVNIVYFEDFSNGMPSNFNIVDKDGKTPDPNVGWPANTAWRVVSGEARSISWYTPPGASDDWMITGAIDIPVATSVGGRTLLSWFARAVDPQYPDGYQVYITTAGNQPEDFTELLFSIPAEVPAPGAVRAVDISDYEGETVYIAFRNNSNDQFILVVDNIQIAEIAPNDASTVRLLNRAYNPGGSLVLSQEVANTGSAPITEMVVSYSIDGGAAVDAAITGLNIAPLAVSNVAHPIAWDADLGLHDVEIWVSSVNGVDLPNAQANGVTRQVSIYDAADVAVRRTIVEGFSSSTCGPCAPANTTFHNLMNTLAPANRPVTLKYQLGGPGTGDPYTTNETEGRAVYYNVTGIPDSRIDGNFWNGLTGSVTATILNNAKNRPGLATFDLEYSVDTTAKTVHISGTVTPSADMVDGTKLMIAIKESSTTKNVKTNGETIFRDVVKKLINGLQGIELGGLKAGEPFPVDISYAFKGNYRLPINGLVANRINHDIEHSVENFANLLVSAWVDFPREQYILNAADAELMVSSTRTPVSLNRFTVFPNPVINEAQLDLDLSEALDCQITVFDAQGRQIAQVFQGLLNAGQHRLPVNMEDAAAGTYFVHLRSDKGLSIQTLHVVR